MRTRLVSLLLIGTTALFAEKWGTYGHDNYQSRISRSKIDLSKTDVLWEKDSGFRPQPAWGGSAIQDFYDNRGVMLKDMRDYDLSDGLIYFDDKLVVTSSARNTVYCYDVKSGAEIWYFTTGGAIRVSATYNKGDIYLGSDDGFVYCLDAETGTKRWVYSPSLNSDNRKVLQHGKIVSTMPCRTGVTIVGNTAYCGFSFLPWKSSYICALNATTGEEIYCKEHTKLERAKLGDTGVTMEGPFAYSAGRIIAPMGRLAPKVFSAADGSFLATMPNGGGSFLLVSPNREIVHAPGHQGGWVDTAGQEKTLFGQVSRSSKSSTASDKGSIIRINSALKAVIDNRLVYAVSETELSCVDRLNNNTTLWTTPIDCHYSIIMAGGILFLGGDNQIKAVDSKTGAVLGATQVNGKVHNIIAGDGYLFASTNEGVVYAYQQSDSSAFFIPTITPNDEFTPGNSTLKAGPIATFTGKNQATISWTTESAEASTVNYGIGVATLTKTDATAKTSHSIVIDNLDYNKKYVYNITTTGGNSQNYELNTFFNFQKNDLSTNGNLVPSPTSLQTKAETIKSDSGIDRGVALVAGVSSGELIYNLAKNTQLHVIAVDTDEQKVQTCRNNLHNNKSYGTRISVLHVEDYNSLEWPELFANIITTEQQASPISGSFITKYLNPYNGSAYLDTNWDAGNEDITTHTTATLLKAQIPVPADHGKWNNLYGSNDNTAFNGEGLGGSAATTDMQLQWIGRPGPLHQADRSGRKTSPLAQNGILYIEGLERIITMDASNGCVLWNMEIPDFTRMNTPRDSSNYVCDDSNVYLAVNDVLYTVNGYTGAVTNILDTITNPAMNPTKNWSYDWSYLGSTNDLLIGSSVKSGTAYTNFKGGRNAGWYDSATHAAVVSKVCSDILFAVNKDDHTKAWEYFNTNGLIVNPTITINGDNIIFVETREADRKSADTRRLNSLDQDLYLVCLNRTTGSKIWEQLLNVTQGVTMANMSSSQNKVVLCMSNNWKYYVYAYDLNSGNLLWTNSEIGWMQYSHHGKHMARPAIVDNKVYIRPGILDLETGELVLNTNVMYGGCGTYSCTAHGLFYRGNRGTDGGNINMYDLANDTKSTSWSRIRPDCWLSMIPACGLLLAPEGGGGCDCAEGWIESTVAFRPVSRPGLNFKFSNRTFYSSSYDVQVQNLKHRNYQVRYTLDGSEPTDSSPVYNAPINISVTTTVKAALFNQNSKVSETISATFEKKQGDL